MKYLSRWSGCLSAFLVFSCLTSVAASTLSTNYDSVLSATQALIQPRQRGLVDLESQVVQVASTFATVPGENGSTIFPVGTRVDRAEISNGTLSLFLTLPAGTARQSLDPAQVFQGMEILRDSFAEQAGLTKTVILARVENDLPDYVSLEEFLNYNPPTAVGTREVEVSTDYEIGGPGPQPDVDLEPLYAQARREAEGNVTRDIPGQGNLSSSGLPQGSLAGRIIFTFGGHGRTWDGTKWRWQREYYNGMLEDFGNSDAADYYANYCFNAGATVVPMRPIGYQDNEVVLDNTSPGVTRTGTWNNSVNARYYGSGTPNYYWAESNAAETATVTYTPNIPEAGYYPVYTWANYGSDRIPGGQLYKIRSTGGESLVRIDHRRIGCGWVYLGSYYFNAGANAATGSVVISNQNPPGISSTDYVAVADAIRFGNGMGDVKNGGTVSGYSRKEESTVYWIENGWGNGTSSGQYSASEVWNNSATGNDEELSWSAPPRMAAQMLRLHSGDSLRQYALYLDWHSNANNGSARGSMGLITGNPTANQAWWAAKVSDEVDAASNQEDSNWEYTWFDRSDATFTGGYGEITNSYLMSKMDATIIEVAFHDNAIDAALMRDPKVRSIHARGAYHATVSYFNKYQGVPLVYAPERPTKFRAVNAGDGNVTLGWAAGLTGGTRGHAATSYRVYKSRDGLGWGAGETVTGLTHTLTGLTPGQTWYFRVAALNSGGESFPTETLAVRVNSAPANVLVVNGFDRLDRFNNVLRPAGLSKAPEQLQQQRNNTYNYIRQHAAALVADGRYFDSTSNEAVISGNVALSNYASVVWILGEESLADKTFDATEQSLVQNYLSGGGNLFVTGSDTAYELDNQNRGRTFYRSDLRASYVSQSAGTYSAVGAPGSIFNGISEVAFGGGSDMYDPDKCNVISPQNGAATALLYSPEVLLDDFDTKGTWQDPGYSGTTTADSSTFDIVSSPKVQGTGSGRIGYNWTLGTKLREYNSNSPLFPKSATFSIWVYGDNSGHKLRFMVRDSTDGELFQSPQEVINWTGWRKVSWDLATAPLSKFAGTGDGVITGNVRLDNIYMEKAGVSMTGNVYFDNATYTVGTPTKVAGVQYAGTYKLVNLAIPFETIESESVRNQIMHNVMLFFETTSGVNDWSIY